MATDLGASEGRTPGPAQPLLNEEDKARLREQEIFRKELRAELERKSGSILTGENVKWLITTLIIPASVWAFGFAGQRVIDNRQDVAQLTALLPGLTSTNQQQRCVAVTVLAQLVSVDGASKEIKATYEKIRGRAADNQKAGDPSVRAEAAETIGCINLVDSSSKPAPPSQPAVAGSQVATGRPPPPTSVLKADDVVYLQIYREDQRQAATLLKEQIQQAGFPVVGIENVATTHPDTASTYPQLRSVDVRFYHGEDRDAARGLTTIINKILPFKV